MQIPNITLPTFIKKMTHYLPERPPQYALVTLLNQLLNRGILPADMSLLANRIFEIVVSDMGMTIRFSANEQKFLVNSSGGEPDLRLTANTAEFFKMMLRKEDPDTLFFNRKLDIEGDTELGLIAKNLLDSIDWTRVPFMKLLVD